MVSRKLYKSLREDYIEKEALLPTIERPMPCPQASRLCMCVQDPQHGLNACTRYVPAVLRRTPTLSASGWTTPAARAQCTGRAAPS
jgi:hypothetical protein